MTEGIVFDIEEFAVYDGPGIRSVVFLKGCPLRCRWCHNPEGLLRAPQRLKSRELCIQCGACDAVCAHPDACTACGACVKVCPRGALSIAGQPMSPEQVAAKVLPNKKILQMSGGGITFSGGEALMQPDFVVETRALMSDLHAVLETCGYADAETFDRVVASMDLVLFDIKLVDPALHKYWTGADNAPILTNLQSLIRLGKPFRARIPLIPTVTDTAQNLRAAAEFLEGAQGLERVELMSYNRAAGAKYGQLGLDYLPEFPEDRPSNLFTAPFVKRGMEVITL